MTTAFLRSQLRKQSMPIWSAVPDGCAGGRGADFFNVPNAITLTRLGAAPIAVWLALRDHLAGCFVVFAAAGATDAIDGWLARRRGGSVSGAMLDPLADKVLLVSMFVVLAVVGVLPEWLVVMTVGRDVVIVAGLLVLWRMGRLGRMRPLMVSKLNTALQLLLITLALLLRGFRIEAQPVLDALIWIVAATTLISGLAYVWNGARGRLP